MKAKEGRGQGGNAVAASIFHKEFCEMSCLGEPLFRRKLKLKPKPRGLSESIALSLPLSIAVARIYRTPTSKLYTNDSVETISNRFDRPTPRHTKWSSRKNSLLRLRRFHRSFVSFHEQLLNVVHSVKGRTSLGKV